MNQKMTVERLEGNVSISEKNLLIKDTYNMEEVEYWENRLENILKQPFAITFRKNDEGKIVYSIYTSLTPISITYLHTPMWIPYLFVPIGGGMVAIGLLIEVIGKLRNLRKPPDETE